jgi:hypothetical protein
MTKPTQEQIDERLKQVKEGDVLTTEQLRKELRNRKEKPKDD